MSYNDEWKYVIERIKELRQARGMSIQALADYANIDRSNLNNIENGKVDNMWLSTLCKIAEALEVSPAELLRR